VFEIYRAIARLISDGQTVAVATVIETRGSAPRGPGAKMVVTADGRSFGTVGGGWPESEVQRAAMEAMRAGIPRVCRVEMTGCMAANEGAICGGTMEVFIEPLRLGRLSTMAQLSESRRIE
jgi:xanthine dehydrogenase accessory factor